MKRRLHRLKPNNPPRENAMTFQLSHVAIPVTDMACMRQFYTRTLGFVVTDQKGEYPGETVFMSANPNEHHQVVLAASGGTVETDAVLGHFAISGFFLCSNNVQYIIKFLLQVFPLYDNVNESVLQ